MDIPLYDLLDTSERRGATSWLVGDCDRRHVPISHALEELVFRREPLCFERLDRVQASAQCLDYAAFRLGETAKRAGEAPKE